MKHTKARHLKANGQAEYDLVTRLQKKCISDISVLCSKRYDLRKKRRIFGFVSSVFFLISVFTLLLSLVRKLVCGRDDKAYSLIAVISAAASLVSGALEVVEAEKEKILSNEISLLEDVIDSSENL